MTCHNVIKILEIDEWRHCTIGSGDDVGSWLLPRDHNGAIRARKKAKKIGSVNGRVVLVTSQYVEVGELFWIIGRFTFENNHSEKARVGQYVHIDESAPEGEITGSKIWKPISTCNNWEVEISCFDRRSPVSPRCCGSFFLACRARGKRECCLASKLRERNAFEMKIVSFICVSAVLLYV